MAIIGFIYYAIAAICLISFYFINFKTKDGAYIKCVLVCVVSIVSLLNFISYLLFIGVMYAARKDKACAYLPYLIIQVDYYTEENQVSSIQGIGLVVWLILAIFSVIICILIATAVATINTGHSQNKTAAKGMTTNKGAEKFVKIEISVKN